MEYEDARITNDNARLTFALVLAAGMAYGEANVHQSEDPTKNALLNIARFCLNAANRDVCDDMVARGMIRLVV